VSSPLARQIPARPRRVGTAKSAGIRFRSDRPARISLAGQNRVAVELSMIRQLRCARQTLKILWKTTKLEKKRQRSFDIASRPKARARLLCPRIDGHWSRWGVGGPGEPRFQRSSTRTTVTGPGLWYKIEMDGPRREHRSLIIGSPTRAMASLPIRFYIVVSLKNYPDLERMQRRRRLCRDLHPPPVPRSPAVFGSLPMVRAATVHPS